MTMTMDMGMGMDALPGGDVPVEDVPAEDVLEDDMAVERSEAVTVAVHKVGCERCGSGAFRHIADNRALCLRCGYLNIITMPKPNALSRQAQRAFHRYCSCKRNGLVSMGSLYAI